MLIAQDAIQESLSQHLEKLTAAMARTQAQLAQSQHDLDQMRRELAALQRQMAESGSNAPASQGGGVTASPLSTQGSDALSSSVEEIREQQAMQESQIATHEQTKVESESKYPVKITGLLLFNSFVNTGNVDMAPTPTLAIGGRGSTGATVRQTILGFDARGPHLFGAQSSADVRVDFDGVSQSANAGTGYSSSYGGIGTFLRLRTAHATLHWEQTDAFFSLDRPLVSPDTPTSLTAVAEPGLAWSGNLWTWNPQVGATHDFHLGDSHNLRFQSALIDVGDAPYSEASSTAAGGSQPPSAAEQSRWPGIQSRLALSGMGTDEKATRIGLGGYFSPHTTSLGYRYKAWAATADAHLRLPLHLELNGSVYRGMALGGLGGGAYKDFVYRADPDSAGYYYYRALDDIGGWAQLKERLSNRFELNAALGLDQVVAHELRRYAVTSGTMLQNLSGNRTYTGNVIYSPSAYLLFSLEYRYLQSSPVIGSPAASNILGLAAGYRF